MQTHIHTDKIIKQKIHTHICKQITESEIITAHEMPEFLSSRTSFIDDVMVGVQDSAGEMPLTALFCVSSNFETEKRVR